MNAQYNDSCLIISKVGKIPKKMITISDVCFMFLYLFCSKHFSLWYTFKVLESTRA
jgi:hypothetical protein